MLYRVSLFVPNPRQGGWDRTETSIVGSMRACELYAVSKLKPETDSSYGAKVTRRPFVEAHPVVHWRSEMMALRKEPKQYREYGKKVTFETPVRIAPFVGELGYSP